MAYNDQYPYGFDANGNPIDPATGQPIQPAAPATAAAAASGYQPSSPITNQDNPQDAARQDRAFAYTSGQNLNNGLDSDQGNARNALGTYTNTANQLYDPLMNGQGGYTQDQFSNILQAPAVNGLQQTQDEYNRAGLTDAEFNNIQGNSNDRSKYFNPNQENDIFNSGATAERGAVGDYQKGLSSAYDPNALRPGQGYADSLQGGVDQYGSTVNSALDPSKLNVSDQFLQDYKMTPEEQQAIKTSAASVVGTRDKAAIGELERKARAAGTNPLGVAAARQRMERGASAGAADAATAASIGASNAAADRLKTGEDMRLRYGQGAAGMKVDAAGRVLDAGYRANTTAENARSAAEKDIADRNTYAAQQGGQANMANTSDLAKRALGLQQNITQVGNTLAQDKDTTDSQRAAALATNRQGVEQYNQAQRYQRGTDISNTLSNRYKYGADATRADATEGRGYVTGQVAQANANNNYLTGQKVGLYGSQNSAIQGGTKTQGQLYDAAKARPSTFDKIIGGIGSVAKVAGQFAGGFADGGVVTSPTMAMIGENGPEMVVPLNAQNPQVPPSMALQPGQPQPFDTDPQRLKAAYSQQYQYGA